MRAHWADAERIMLGMLTGHLDVWLGVVPHWSILYLTGTLLSRSLDLLSLLLGMQYVLSSWVEASWECDSIVGDDAKPLYQLQSRPILIQYCLIQYCVTKESKIYQQVSYNASITVADLRILSKLWCTHHCSWHECLVQAVVYPSMQLTWMYCCSWHECIMQAAVPLNWHGITSSILISK